MLSLKSSIFTIFFIATGASSFSSVAQACTASPSSVNRNATVTIRRDSNSNRTLRIVNTRGATVVNRSVRGRNVRQTASFDSGTYFATIDGSTCTFRVN